MINDTHLNQTTQLIFGNVSGTFIVVAQLICRNVLLKNTLSKCNIYYKIYSITICNQKSSLALNRTALTTTQWYYFPKMAFLSLVTNILTVKVAFQAETKQHSMHGSSPPAGRPSQSTLKMNHSSVFLTHNSHLSCLSHCVDIPKTNQLT